MLMGNMKNLSYTKKNGNICFREDDHVYFDITNPDRKFISVTTLIEKFAQPFDKDFWSAYKALEKLLDKDAWTVEKKSLLSTKQFNPSILEAHDISIDAFNKEQQGILDEWDAENRKSCERGTKIHTGFEQAFYKQKTDISLKRFELGGKFECRKDYTDLNLEHAVYPEYLVHRISKDGKFCLAGQIDLLVKNGNHFSIVDHKTNKKIETKSFYNKQTRTTTKMQFPLNNLDDTNYWHYALQLSTYAWMIKQLNPSYIIDDLILNHVDHSNNVTIYHVPYLEKEVIRMLNFYKKQAILDENKKKRQPIVY